ncbi:hypothetical protein [Streptomyces sp. NPDC058308]|uniref:hypothetical protein n=1 Tax=Streptomyces sp. NPDC058308 TaxID=3346440 RepID=UPI0036E1F698
MNRYDPERETSRTTGRPSDEPAPLLALIKVTPALPVPEYARRLRALVREALDITKDVDFDDESADDISTGSLPDWFLSVTDGNTDLVGDSPESTGKRHYLTTRDSNAWDVGEWIYCFDPGLRKWSWWDVTEDASGHACIWVDTKGEGHIPCEELWWAAYVAGARSAADLTVEHAEEWAAQASAGV